MIAGHPEVRPLFFFPAHLQIPSGFRGLGLWELLGEESSAPQKVDPGRPPRHCRTSSKYRKIQRQQKVLSHSTDKNCHHFSSYIFSGHVYNKWF